MKNKVMAVIAVACVVLAACTSTSGEETSAGGAASAITGSTATGTPTPTHTPTPTLGASPRSTGVPRPSARTLMLTAQGLGGVPVGSTLVRFAQILGGSPTPMSATDRSIFADHSCVVRALNRPRGVGFMVIGEDPEGQVRRISILEGSDIRTDRGIGLGSSMDAVRAAYGTGLDEPFDHFPVGGDAVLARAGANLYLVFIGDDSDRVVELSLGFKPEVLSSEGCV